MFAASFNIQGLQSLSKGGTAKDPVCGMDVDGAKAASSSTFGEKTYYFCAPGCKKEFDANPEKYAEND